MVLSGIGIRNSSIQQLSNSYPVDSTWTIDLAFLLRSYGVEDFTMYTSHIGVNWAHQQCQFYKKCFQKDLKRISRLFSTSKESNVRVIHASLDMDDLKRFLLSNRYAIILLVNLSTLSCSLCRERKRKEWYRSIFFKNPKPTAPLGTIQETGEMDIKHLRSESFDNNMGSSHNFVPRRLSWSIVNTPPRQANMVPTNPNRLSPSPSLISLSDANSTTYLLPKKPKRTCLGICNSYGKLGYDYVTHHEFQGHFIVLIGYDRENDVFFYRDPGTDSELCAIGGDELEISFYAKETDRDAIVVRML